MPRAVKKTVAILAILGLNACSTPGIGVHRTETDGQHSSVILSGRASKNVTPYDDVLSCFGNMLGKKRSLSIGVGDIRDYTGKSSDGEGMAITQGGALMAYSALGKIGRSIRIHERFDTRIADAELAYIKSRQLGDGNLHEVPDGETGESQQVPWKPYFGGSILQSEYYIVGGITELNYNIRSSGAEIQVNQVGPKAREYVVNVAVDMRIVGSQSLRVYDTVSVQKQIVGYETGFGIFRFFDNDLFDVYAGEKSQEPMQLGVRMAIEEAVLDLLEGISGVDGSDCRGLSATQ